MSFYDIVIVGDQTGRGKGAIEQAFVDLMREGDIPKADVDFWSDISSYPHAVDGRRPIVAACFSDVTSEELAFLERMARKRLPVIPVARIDESFSAFPAALQPLNGISLSGDDDQHTEVAVGMMECVGLMREQRRIFVSYRRNESRMVAIQLHDELSGRGFNVFLDTHAIRPGKFFQSELWQNLCDSDVVIMLDTPGYFESKWTTEEFGRAQAFDIHILRLVWPDHKPTEETSLAETMNLDAADFNNDVLSESFMNELAVKIEHLRARSNAARHTSISGKLLSEVRGIGGSVVGTGAHRALSVKGSSGNVVWIYPAIGVPTAPLLNNIAHHAEKASHADPIIIYDHQGISDNWLEHLDWLNERIPDVEVLRVSDAAGRLNKPAGSP